MYKVIKIRYNKRKIILKNVFGADYSIIDNTFIVTKFLMTVILCQLITKGQTPSFQRLSFFVWIINYTIFIRCYSLVFICERFVSLFIQKVLKHRFKLKVFVILKKHFLYRKKVPHPRLSFCVLLMPFAKQSRCIWLFCVILLYSPQSTLSCFKKASRSFSN